MRELLKVPTLKVVGNWTVPSLNVFQLPYHTL